ncbi:hypothetical protein ATN88_09105 [Enterovibrio coralii]|uniref:TNase-like domain-containing protein n=2 Tax=Enterovibrio coralii TaxID=294935 RepID=A0A135IA48_9GAMM|nr:hypothetical protein ATN88_09105 [Enterovibrio coralii]
MSFMSWAESTIHQFPATLVKVVDGDTFRMLLEVYPRQFNEVDVRLYGIDAPESRRGSKQGMPIPECEIELGKAVTQHIDSILDNADSLMVNNIDPSKTKFAGRIVGDVWFESDGIEMSVAEYLLEQNLVVPYYGGKRSIWDCDQITR